MSYVDRYVHEVCRRLPLNQRAEAEKDLKTKIDSQIQSRLTASENSDNEDKIIIDVLEAMGNPVKTADEYRGSPRCLIGPSLIDTYWLVLKITLLAASIGIFIALGIQLIVEAPPDAWQAIAKFIGGIFQALITSFGMVTVIFALINHLSGDDLPGKRKADQRIWKVSQLPPLPEAKIRIKRSDSIVSIIFALIFLIIINIYPEVFGYYSQTDSGISIIPVFGDAFKTLLFWINIVVAAGIILDIIKSAFGRWTYFLVVACLGHNIFSLVVALRVLRDPQLINPDFATAVKNLFSRSGAALPANWLEFTLSVITVLVIIGFVVESITIIAKGFRLIQIKYSIKAGGPDDESAGGQKSSKE